MLSNHLFLAFLSDGCHVCAREVTCGYLWLSIRTTRPKYDMRRVLTTSTMSLSIARSFIMSVLRLWSLLEHPRIFLTIAISKTRSERLFSSFKFLLFANTAAVYCALWYFVKSSEVKRIISCLNCCYITLMCSVDGRLVYLSWKYTLTLLLQPHRHQLVEVDHDIVAAASCCNMCCSSVRSTLQQLLVKTSKCDTWQRQLDATVMMIVVNVLVATYGVSCSLLRSSSSHSRRAAYLRANIRNFESNRIVTSVFDSIQNEHN